MALNLHSARRGKIRLGALLGTVALTLGMSAASSGASAAEPPPPLTYELLQDNSGAAGLTRVTAECNPEGTSTIRYDVAGTAAGTYPGTFRETGVVLIGPRDPLLPTYRGVQQGPILSWDASFTITSGDTVVRGTTRLTDVTPPPSFAFGACTTDPGDPEDLCPATDPAVERSTAAAQVGNFGLVYDAVIETPQGNFTDRGTAHAQLEKGEARCASGSTSFRYGYTEFLYSDLLQTVPVVLDDDSDDDGSDDDGSDDDGSDD